MASVRNAVQSQGQLMPIPGGSEMLQASAGTDYSGPLAPYGVMGSSPDGIGAYARLGHMPVPAAYQNGSLGFTGSPLINAVKRIARRNQLSGLGDAGSAAAPVLAGSLLVGVVIVGLAATGVAGYYVGKAVAPSRDRESKYAWWGVAAALLGGPVGLGIEAGVALTHGGGR